MNSSRALVSALASVVVLATGCSAPQPAPEASVPVTETTTVSAAPEEGFTTENATLGSSGSSLLDVGAQQQSPHQEPEYEYPALLQLPRQAVNPEEQNALDHAPPGTVLPLFGEQVRGCIGGNGYGTRMWAANEHTSCDLVSELYDILQADLLKQHHPDNPLDIRFILPTRVNVPSPVTGETYDVVCTRLDAAVNLCSGGNQIRVYIY